MVLVKGLYRADLQGIIEEAFGTTIGLQSIDRVKFRLALEVLFRF